MKRSVSTLAACNTVAHYMHLVNLSRRAADVVKGWCVTEESKAFFLCALPTRFRAANHRSMKVAGNGDHGAESAWKDCCAPSPCGLLSIVATYIYLARIAAMRGSV